MPTALTSEQATAGTGVPGIDMTQRQQSLVQPMQVQLGPSPHSQLRFRRMEARRHRIALCATGSLGELQQKPRHVYVPEDRDEDAPQPSAFLPSYRPWLSLYGARIRAGGHETNSQELSPIQAMLPLELVASVFQHLSPMGVGAAACVCQSWRSAAETPALWQAACQSAFSNDSKESLLCLLRKHHRCRWKDMYLDRPHMRFDGVYVSRNTYIKRGVIEWRVRVGCHVVAYYRYMCFQPDGSFLYRTSPEVVSKVAKGLQDYHRTRRHKRDDSISRGRYLLDGERLFTKLRYPTTQSSEVRTKLQLRSTVRGAHNRLDILSINSYDRVAGSSSDLSGTYGADEADEDGTEMGETRSHVRGMSTYVFVPWEQVATSLLNKSVDEMDVWIPG